MAEVVAARVGHDVDCLAWIDAVWPVGKVNRVAGQERKLGPIAHHDNKDRVTHP